MSKNEDDQIKKIFGKTAVEILSSKPVGYTEIAWKQRKTRDGNEEMLFASLPVSSLKEANLKAGIVIDTLKSYGTVTNENSHISIFSDGLVIILYGQSKKEITEQDWAMARDVEYQLNATPLLI